MGAASGLYDKFVMSPNHLGLDRMQVLSWYSLYQALMMMAVTALLWWPNRKNTTPFHWNWGIPFISLFLCGADFLYMQALAQTEALIAVVSMIRRGSVLVSFAIGAFILKEKNLKSKSLDLLLLLLSMILLYLGSR
jgi:drug/metabolite transporter (DMT)-like permease